MEKTKVIIMGAAGMDFHTFNTCFRDNEKYDVKYFTTAAEQNLGTIETDKRKYPYELAGSLYPNGIPIEPEEKLNELIKESKIDEIVFAYSDVSFDYIMHIASRVQASGANFKLIGPAQTMLKSNKPVIAICAVRTGCGKSQASRKVCKILKNWGYKVVAVREPMPYGDLVEQTCMRFATYEDFEKHKCTIEEREEYEPYVENGFVIYAGVDYQKILDEAEKEADIIVWDGGNNEVSFYKPDLQIVLVDPLRPGHEIGYYPGETNLRLADVVIINKIDTAYPEDILEVRENVKMVNSKAIIIDATSPLFVEKSSEINGKKVLVVEDGPTLTHGDMEFGAGLLAAEKFGASEIVEPKDFAVGSIKETFLKFPHLENVLPAMGYGNEQIKELEDTINATPCDLIISGTPIDLGKIVDVKKPIVRVRYEIQEIGKPNLEDVLKQFRK